MRVWGEDNPRAPDIHETRLAQGGACFLHLGAQLARQEAQPGAVRGVLGDEVWSSELQMEGP